MRPWWIVCPRVRLVTWSAVGLLAALPLPSVCLGAQQTQMVKLLDATPVHLTLLDDLNSKTNHVGDPVRFRVRQDVMVEGLVVIPEGTVAEGHVAIVGHKGMAGHAGRITFAIDSLKAPDGSVVKLRGLPSISGGGNGSVAAAAAVYYSPAALLVMRGSDADIRKGVTLNAYVDGDRQITVTIPEFFVKPPASQAGPSPPAVSATPALRHRPVAPPAGGESPLAADDEGASVALKSTPDGVDILIDGEFVGNTPSELRLKPGNHSIAFEKAGYKTWQRSMTVSSGGKINIEQSLEKQP